MENIHDQASANNHFVDAGIPFSELMKKEVVKTNGQWITPIAETGEEHDVEEV